MDHKRSELILEEIAPTVRDLDLSRARNKRCLITNVLIKIKYYTDSKPELPKKQERLTRTFFDGKVLGILLKNKLKGLWDFLGLGKVKQARISYRRMIFCLKSKCK